MGLTVVAMCWQRAAARVRGWVLWTLPPALVGLLCAVVVAAGLLTVGGILATPVRSGQLVSWLVLSGCAAVCLEGMRRVGEPAGIAKDLLVAWTLPVALLLPPVYSLLMPVPLMVWRQRRVRPSLLYRRTYRAWTAQAPQAPGHLRHICASTSAVREGGHGNITWLPAAARRAGAYVDVMRGYRDIWRLRAGGGVSMRSQGDPGRSRVPV